LKELMVTGLTVSCCLVLFCGTPGLCKPPPGAFLSALNWSAAELVSNPPLGLWLCLCVCSMFVMERYFVLLFDARSFGGG
jgi:hypothetical protein